MTIQLSCTLSDQRTFRTKPFALVDGKQWGMFEQVVAAGQVAPKPLPRILGAKLYVKSVAFNVWECAVRISNAACKADGSGFCGEVNFKSTAWQAGPGLVIKPTFRRAWTDEAYCVAFNGADQTMQAGASFVRRFLVGTPKAISVYMHSIPIVPRIVSDYGPLRSTLPAVNRSLMQSRFAGRLATLEGRLAAGVADPDNGVSIPALGYFQGAGDDLSYMYGGADIQPVFGYEQCPAAVQWHADLADLWLERTNVACYDKDTGEPIPSEAWGNGKQPFDCLADGDEERVIDGRKKHYPPALDVDPKTGAPIKPFNTGNNPNKAKIQSYGTPNDDHFIRAIGHAIPAIEYLHDEVMRDYVIDCAHFLRRAHCDVGILGQYARSLANNLNYARKNPGSGLVISRGFGWANLVCACAMKYEPKNAIWQKWSDALLEYHRVSATASGISQNAAPKAAFPEAWDTVDAAGKRTKGYAGCPDDTHLCQAFEQGIVTFGVGANLLCRGSVSITTPKPSMLRKLFPNRNVAILMRAANSIWANFNLPTGAYDNPMMFGVSKYVDPRGLVARGYGPADLTHNENALAVVYRLSGDISFLKATLRLGIRANDLAGKKRAAQANVDAEGVYDEWQVELLSVLQEVAP